MVNKKNIKLLEKFNKKQIENKKLSLQQKLKIFNFMLKEYISLKIYKKHMLMEDIESDIKIARILNSLK